MNKLITHYSEWLRLRKSVAWFLRLRGILIQLKNKRKELEATISQAESNPEKQKTLVKQHLKKHKSTMESSPLSLEDLAKAEVELIHFSQLQGYTDEIKALQKDTPVKKNSQIYKLDPILQGRILRVGGRLTKAAIPQEAKNPAILSKDSHLASLILQHIHQEIGHCGRNFMLAKLRQKYCKQIQLSGKSHEGAQCAGDSTQKLENKK